jgi:GNAT superfamily N-acetyltransferase
MTDVWRIRDLRAGEFEAVFAGLSARSRYLRFHAPVPRLTGPMRAALGSVAAPGFALVAVDRTGRPLGIVRMVQVRPGHGELAVEVVDAAHRRGIGTALLRAAADRAPALKIKSFEGSVLSANRPMLSLLRRLFLDVSYSFDGPAVQVYIPAPTGR